MLKLWISLPQNMDSETSNTNLTSLWMYNPLRAVKDEYVTFCLASLSITNRGRFCVLRNNMYFHAAFFCSSWHLLMHHVSLCVAWKRGTFWSCTVRYNILRRYNVLRRSTLYLFEWKLWKLGSSTDVWTICWYSKAPEVRKNIKQR